MDNYNNTDLLEIKRGIERSIGTIQESITWSNEHLTHETKSNLNVTFKNYLNVLNKINSNIGSKPVMAVFGASQVGKSYLIKNLLLSFGILSFLKWT